MASGKQAGLEEKPSHDSDQRIPDSRVTGAVLPEHSIQGYGRDGGVEEGDENRDDSQ
jgi:hypothetical protein